MQPGAELTVSATRVAEPGKSTTAVIRTIGDVEIADRVAHRSLAYITAVTDNGHALTVEEFQAYINGPDRLLPRSQAHQALEAVRQAFLNQLGAVGAEHPLEYLERVRWVEVVEAGDEHVRATGVGRAVLRALDRQAVEEETPLDVVLDDPELSLPRVVGLLAEAGNAALVEPYLDAASLLAVVRSTSIDRILTSSLGRKGRTAEIVETLALLKPSLDARPLEVRVSDAFHDRFVIPRSGPIRTLGTGEAARGFNCDRGTCGC